MMVFVPLTHLADLEKKYLPGSVQYTFGRDIAQFTTRIQTGPVEVLNGFLQILQMDPPNDNGYRYFYDEALTASIQDMDKEIRDGLSKLPKDFKSAYLKVYV